MTKQEFIVFTCLCDVLKGLGKNFTEFIEKPLLDNFLEIGKQYAHLTNDEIREELVKILTDMANQHFKS